MEVEICDILMISVGQSKDMFSIKYIQGFKEGSQDLFVAKKSDFLKKSDF